MRSQESAAPPVRSFASGPARQQARTGRPGAFGPPVGVGVAAGARQAQAGALGVTLGVGVHVILGIAVSRAVTRGDVAAVA